MTTRSILTLSELLRGGRKRYGFATAEAAISWLFL